MLKLLIDENLDHRILRGFAASGSGFIVYRGPGDESAGVAGFRSARMGAGQRSRAGYTVLRAVLQQARLRCKNACVIIVKRVDLARAIADLELLVQCATPSELENQIVFIPF